MSSSASFSRSAISSPCSAIAITATAEKWACSCRGGGAMSSKDRPALRSSDPDIPGQTQVAARIECGLARGIGSCRQGAKRRSRGATGVERVPHIVPALHTKLLNDAIWGGSQRTCFAMLRSIWRHLCRHVRDAAPRARIAPRCARRSRKTIRNSTCSGSLSTKLSEYSDPDTSFSGPPKHSSLRHRRYHR